MFPSAFCDVEFDERFLGKDVGAQLGPLLIHTTIVGLNYVFTNLNYIK